MTNFDPSIYADELNFNCEYVYNVAAVMCHGVSNLNYD